MAKLKQKLSDLSERLFVERELFLRSDGRVRYLRVSRRLQATAAIAVAVDMGWVAYSSVNVVFHNQIVSDKEAEIEHHQHAYLDLLTEVGEYHDQFTRITRNLEDNQTYLLSLLARGGLDAEELADVEWQLKQSRTERARMALAREGLRERLDKFEAELTTMAKVENTLRSRIMKVAQAFMPGGSDEVEVASARDHLVTRVRQMDAEGFGNCTNQYECSAVCPKDISASWIAKLNRHYAAATVKDVFSSGGEPGAYTDHDPALL